MESCTVPVRPLKCQIQLTAENGDSELQLPVADFQNHSEPLEAKFRDGIRNDFQLCLTQETITESLLSHVCSFSSSDESVVSAHWWIAIFV